MFTVTFSTSSRLSRAHRPDAIVLLGDLQARRRWRLNSAILMQTEVWFIHGNHDTDSEADHDHLLGSKLASRNLHGRVATIAGVRIAGLGGIFRGRSGARQSPASTSRRRISWRAAARATAGAAACHYSTAARSFPMTMRTCQNCARMCLSANEAPSAHPHGFEATDELARA